MGISKTTHNGFNGFSFDGKESIGTLVHDLIGRKINVALHNGHEKYADILDKAEEYTIMGVKVTKSNVLNYITEFNEKNKDKAYIVPPGVAIEQVQLKEKEGWFDYDHLNILSPRVEDKQYNIAQHFHKL